MGAPQHQDAFEWLLMEGTPMDRLFERTKDLRFERRFLSGSRLAAPILAQMEAGVAR